MFTKSFVTCPALTRCLLNIVPLALSIFLLSSTSSAQTYKIKGVVYDSTRSYGLEAVSVLSTGGRFAVTDAEGNYAIEVAEKDSIWFSFLNKPTVKYPVLQIADPMAFDIALHVNIPVLREVKLRPRNYRQDSMQNRLDYAKIFNYEKPKLRPTVSTSGVGFDVVELINMFRFKRNKSLAGFKKRLLTEEEEKFISHRFSKALVRRLTLLDGPELDSFMRLYRPAYSFTRQAGDYEFQLYIKSAFVRFKKGLYPLSMLKPEE